MRRLGFCLIFSLYFSGVNAQPSHTSDPNTIAQAAYKQTAFKRGEVLNYRMHYGWVDAGWVKIKVENETREVGGRKTFHFVGTGESNKTFDLFFKVRDRYESYVDEESLTPWIFIRRVNEGGFLIHQDYIFNPSKKKVDTGNNLSYDIPENCQDMTSAFYFARCLNYDHAKIGEVFSINSFIDKEVFTIKIRYMGRDTISTTLGRIACIRFCPILQKGRIFKRSEDLIAWISDDANRIPVRVQAKILVGSVKMDLQSYENLANPLAKLK